MVELFRAEVDPDLSIATVAVFLFIAQRHESGERLGPRVSEIAQGLGMDIPKTSRAVRVLSEGHPRAAKTAEGAGLVEVRPDPMDTRARRAKLTQRGQHFLHRAQLAIT
ncbi:MAG: hypothetical protein A2882_07190 [Phenylobacterium sp. RIFCSPHIGHO2_01_FULL_70_10]|nr:MAG: hypothetical protein A2882_07190 [Phenylobacterium sp. RIFCSPHIGHO2_01_FULL_70_10]